MHRVPALVARQTQVCDERVTIRGQRILTQTMSLSRVSRSLPRRLSRSFTTTSTCRNSDEIPEPSPPRRKGRTPRVNPKTQSLLPPQKLRALVSLYHQSDDFITLENLEQRIDAAFMPSASGRYADGIGQSAFDELLKTRRTAQRMAPWNLEAVASSSSSGGWSTSVSSRERQIIDALCGVDTPRTGVDSKTLPGYGTLMEARKQRHQQNGGVV